MGTFTIRSRDVDEELVNILEIHRVRLHHVYSTFLDVNTSDVDSMCSCLGTMKSLIEELISEYHAVKEVKDD